MTKIDLEGAIKFDVDWDLYTNYLSTPESVITNSKSPEILESVEENVKLWMKSMERVKIAGFIKKKLCKLKLQ